MATTVTKTVFGKYPDGRDCFLYTMTNENGMEVAVTTVGAAIVKLIVPDAEGKKAVISPEQVADMFWNILHGKSPLQVIDGKFRIQDLAAKIPGVI